MLFAIAGNLFFVALIQRAIGLHRSNAIFRRGAGFIQLAGENNLAVTGFQHKTKLPIAAIAQFKKACHEFPFR